MKFFDPENMNKVPARDRNNLFVPTEELPDQNPDPSEALMLKEEAMQEKSTSTKEEMRSHLNDLSRPSNLERFSKRPPEISHNGDYESTSFIEKVGEEASDDAERADVRRKHPIDWGKDIVESHGKRGRVPKSKNRPSAPLDGE